MQAYVPTHGCLTVNFAADVFCSVQNRIKETTEVFAYTWQLYVQTQQVIKQWSDPLTDISCYGLEYSLF